MSQYQYLFSPIALGSVRVRNRIVFSAHLTNFAEDNLPRERLTAYYRERARGGAGLIITEEQSVHPSDFAYEKLVHAYDPAVVPYYRKLTGVVKDEESTIFCQLNHNGAQGFSFFNDEPLWGASPVGDGLFREVPSAIGPTQIAELVVGYGQVAHHAEAGGFDGVELQASHSSILRQFLSPHSNRRDDAYGGCLEGRLRLIVECLQAVRKAVSPTFAVGIRLCTDELTDGGLVLDDVLEVAQQLERRGLVDFINTSIGTTARLYMVEGPMIVPAGYQSAHTAAVREVVSVPVIGVGRVNDPLAAERLLRDGVADLVGIVRAQIADADWARKSHDDHAAEIRKCIACNQYCIGLMGLNRPLSCIQNPANGAEAVLGGDSYALIAEAGAASTGSIVNASDVAETTGKAASGTMSTGRQPAQWLGKIQRTGRKKTMVIGGGPAGMEAAIVAARSGHWVTLIEQEGRLGGTVNHIVQVPQRLEYGDLIRNKSSEVQRYGVEVRLEQTATVESILAEHPDAVIVATGQEETRPVHITGMDGPRVYTPLQMLAEGRPEGHVLIIDEIGFHQATSLAEWLGEGGCRVTLVTSAFAVGQELGVTLDLELWHQRMGGFDVAYRTGQIVLEVSGDPVLMDIYSNTQTVLEAVDWIVPVNHGRSRDALYHGLVSHPNPPETLLRVGDALSPKDVGEAILDGHRAARQIDGLELGWQ